MRLNIVLTTSEVPHKVTPVHETNLVAEEELEVLAKGWAVFRFLLTAIVIAYAFSFDIRPRLVSGHVVRLCRVHTREEHLKLVHVLITGLISRYYVAVFFPFYSRCRSVLRVTLFLYRNTHIALHLQFHRRIIGLSVEEWRIAILLAVEVVFQREDIVWRVLIHWGVRIGANHYRRITGIANHHHRHHHGNRIQPTCRDNIFLHKEYHQHRDNQHYANHSTLFDKWHTSQRHCQYKGDDGAGVDGSFFFNNLVTLPYCPYERCCHQYQIDCQTCIEWAT